MNFIKLTSVAGPREWYNMSVVKYLEDRGETTMMQFIDGSCIEVMETPHEIMMLVMKMPSI